MAKHCVQELPCMSKAQRASLASTKTPLMLLPTLVKLRPSGVSKGICCCSHYGLETADCTGLSKSPKRIPKEHQTQQAQTPTDSNICTSIKQQTVIMSCKQCIAISTWSSPQSHNSPFLCLKVKCSHVEAKIRAILSSILTFSFQHAYYIQGVLVHNACTEKNRQSVSAFGTQSLR